MFENFAGICTENLVSDSQMVVLACALKGLEWDGCKCRVYEREEFKESAAVQPRPPYDATTPSLLSMLLASLPLKYMYKCIYFRKSN